MGEQTLRKSLTQTSYREVSYRYVNFFVYILAALVNSLPTQTFSSINSKVEQKFHFSAVIVTLNTLLFPIVHPIFAFPANLILDKFGMRIGCSIGALLVIAGVWLRTLIQVDEPFWCLAGSALSAIGNIFILNSPSILANNWFKPSSIPSIISFSVLANLMSMTLGASVPGLVLTPQSPVSQIKQFILIEAIIITVPLVLLILLLRQRPPVPPSKAALTRLEKKDKYRHVLKNLFKNIQYIKLMLAMTFQYGAMVSFLSVLDQTLSSIGYKDPGQAAAITILATTIVGIVTTFFFANLIKKTLQYKLIITICLVFGLITFIALQIVYTRLETREWVLAISGGCVGFFLLPLTSLFMAYSSEIVFPLGEGSATGYLFASSQTFGFLLGIGMISFIEKDHEWKSYISMGIHAFFIFISVFFVLATKQILKRTNHERKKTDVKDEDEVLVYDNS